MGNNIENVTKYILKQLEKKTQEASGEYTFAELFPQSFMTKHSKFNSIDELIDAGGWAEYKFEDIPDKEFDDHIAKTTKFKNWQEMKEIAAIALFKKNLKF